MAENTLCSFSTERKVRLTLLFKNESLSRQERLNNQQVRKERLRKMRATRDQHSQKLEGTDVAEPEDDEVQQDGGQKRKASHGQVTARARI